MSARLFLTAVAAALVLLAGCVSTRPSVPTSPEPTPAPTVIEAPPAAPPGPSPEDLYARMTEDRALYEEALELIVAGEEIAGEQALAEAAESLSAGVATCDRTPGCEMDRFLATFDHLLSRQNIELKKQATRIGELEASLREGEVEREPGTPPFVSAVPELGRTVSLLRGTDLREIIALNEPVKAALDDWLTWMRPMLMQAFHNYQYLRDDIAPIYEEAGLPEALLFAIIATESGGKVHAYSRAGAAGPLQFIRRTGRVYGLRIENGFDMRLDPVEATRASVAYLNDRFEELNDSLEKALAAYNGGEGRMRYLNKRLGGASLWDRRMYYSLPRETREYVPRVLAAAWLFLHPDEYNLEWPALETEKAHLVLEREISLGELAICLGQSNGIRDGWFRTLRNLNPRLNPGDRVEAGGRIVVPSVLVRHYRERCLDGEIVARAQELRDAKYPEGSEMIPYVVQRGDTLGRIAARYRCVTVGELAAINGVRPPRYVIRVGQVLKIPPCG